MAECFYGVLEKSANIFVVPSGFGWDDIGSIQALDRFMEKDRSGNVLVGKSESIEGEDNILIASNQRVVVNGLSGIYVIENDGHIIIGRRDEISEIGKLKV